MRDRSVGFAWAPNEHSISSVNRVGLAALRMSVTPRDARRVVGDDRSDQAMANACTRELVADLRRILDKLPDVTGISFNPFGVWTFVYITVATDAAVSALGGKLGLGASEHRTADGRGWYRATSRQERENHSITVIGPFHEEASPSRDPCVSQEPRNRGGR
jgi:hypothetical protein